MVKTCSRCNKELEEKELSLTLCRRCQDVLEFGYQSFPAYSLQAANSLNVKTETN